MSDHAWMTTLWLGATRYYLGRMSYAVSDFCGGLRRAWTALPQETTALIQRDIEEAFARDDEARRNGDQYKPLGMDMDRREWEMVRELWAPNAEVCGLGREEQR